MQWQRDRGVQGWTAIAHLVSASVPATAQDRERPITGDRFEDAVSAHAVNAVESPVGDVHHAPGIDHEVPGPKERRLGRRPAIAHKNPSEPRLLPASCHPRPIDGAPVVRVVRVAPVIAGDDLEGAVVETAVNLLTVGVVQPPLGIHPQGPYQTLLQQPRYAPLRIDTLNASPPGDEEMAAGLEEQRKVGGRLDPGGIGGHLSVGFETRDAGLLPAPSSDIVDEVETAFPVEGHRAGSNARVQGRHGILEDVRLLQQRSHSGLGIVFLRRVLGHADEAGGAAVGFETIDDRRVGHMDAPPGTQGQVLRIVAAVLRPGHQVPAASHVDPLGRVDLVVAEDGDVVTAVRGGHCGDGPRRAARRQRRKGEHRDQKAQTGEENTVPMPGDHAGSQCSKVSLWLSGVPSTETTNRYVPEAWDRPSWSSPSQTNW